MTISILFLSDSLADSTNILAIKPQATAATPLSIDSMAGNVPKVKYKYPTRKVKIAGGAIKQLRPTITPLGPQR